MGQAVAAARGPPGGGCSGIDVPPPTRVHGHHGGSGARGGGRAKGIKRGREVDRDSSERGVGCEKSSVDGGRGDADDSRAIGGGGRSPRPLDPGLGAWGWWQAGSPGGGTGPRAAAAGGGEGARPAAAAGPPSSWPLQPPPGAEGGSAGRDEGPRSQKELGGRAPWYCSSAWNADVDCCCCCCMSAAGVKTADGAGPGPVCLLPPPPHGEPS